MQQYFSDRSLIKSYIEIQIKMTERLIKEAEKSIEFIKLKLKR